ncbi:hypothetical protein [Microbacterium kunmingense]|uniref:hypothetical protein n=1 Tax=Microbacterium kunmingense TaxID=2915939 RepID=UPI003D72E747
MSTPAPDATPAPAGDTTPPAPPAEFKAPASQDELDRIINAAVARTHKKYEGFDDYKSKAEKWDQLEDEKKTPSEKAIEEATQRAAGETAAKYERRIATTEVKAIAAGAGFLDPADALAVLGDEIPKSGDDIDVDELKKRVEKLAQDKPYLVKEQSRKPRQRPKPDDGDPQNTTTAKGGKGKATAALRQLAATRRSS